MKKILFAIFAHPDDESFGPAGTLLMEAKNGTEVHLICLTAGENGTNPDNCENLASVRLAEWHSAGKLMGATGMHHLGYIDGELNNRQYFSIVTKVQAVIDEVLAANTDPDVSIEMMSNDLNGITGHIDHIVAARVACYIFCKRKSEDNRFMRLRLACVPRSWLDTHNTGWLYMEAGRMDEEIDEMIDAREYINDIYSIIHAHYTQRGDGETHIAQRGESLGINYFKVIA